MLDIDGTLLAIFLSFIVFMFIMQKIFYAPMSEVRKERKNYIDTNKDMAASSKKESESLIDNYNHKITQARVQSNSVVLNATNGANEEKSAILQSHSKKVGEETTSAREDLEKQKDTAKESLKPQVISLAHYISSKVLGEEIPISGITSEMIDKLISR